MKINPQFQPVVDFLADHQKKEYFPGAAVAVEFKDELHLKTGIGRLEPDLSSPEVTSETIFDLASLTKPMATATAILQLHENKLIDIQKQISTYLPEFKQSALQLITLFHLLTHTSGLPAWKPLYLSGHGIESMLQTIKQTDLETEPGTKVNYSCLGFILLAEIVRRISKQSLSDYTQQNIFNPLGLTNTMFNPPSYLRAQIAPTEFGNQYERSIAGNEGRKYQYWRKYRLQGEVHDGNSHATDGEGGNAGLFSTVTDLLRFAYCIQNDGKLDSARILSSEIVKSATQNQTFQCKSSRGLGWQMASSSQSAAESFSDNAFGHNGFSGTSLWIDPDQDLIVILLTNRSYYGGNGEQFGKMRADFHHLVVSCL